MPAYFPIVYVRGYAFSDREIEETTDDPTNGFNIGSTHARQGLGEKPINYRFPGPFVRLITDHGYRDVMNRGSDSLEDLKDPRKTLWIHRYYEPYSDTFGKKGKRGRPSIEQAAIELKELIDRILKECFEPTETDKRVILIAHSMGGLVCRSLIQRVLDVPADTIIEKVVTYGTPHGGIPSASPLIRYHGLSNFTRKGMFRALAPKDAKYSEFDPQELTNFPADRFLCVVGTNFSDYDAVFGLARLKVGAGSDGLVLIIHAWVRGAPRVYVHRSHSGRYGLVSSAEAFHAVKRFLFGGFRAALRIQGDGNSPVLPDSGPDGGPGNDQIALLDIECAIGTKGLRVNDRKADHISAMRLRSSPESALTKQEDRSLYVFNFFKSDAPPDGYHFAVNLKIRVDTYQDDGLIRSEVALQQSLRVWITDLDYSFVVRYRWLGEEENTIDTEGNLQIEVPQRSFSETWSGGLSLLLQLARVDAETSGGPERRGGPDAGGSAGGEQTVPEEVRPVQHDYADAEAEASAQEPLSWRNIPLTDEVS
jgi:pimeloyl-ACP methyl ester carboxylesterase